MVPDTPTLAGTRDAGYAAQPDKRHWPLAQLVSSIRLINGGFSDRARGGQPHAEVRSMEGEPALKAVTAKADVGS